MKQKNTTRRHFIGKKIFGEEHANVAGSTVHREKEATTTWETFIKLLNSTVEQGGQIVQVFAT